MTVHFCVIGKTYKLSSFLDVLKNVNAVDSVFVCFFEITNDFFF